MNALPETLRRLGRAPAVAVGALVLVTTGRDRPLRWSRRWVRRLATVLAAVVTYVAFMVAALTAAAAGTGGPAALVVAMVVAQTLPLALALRYPLLGWRIGYLAAALGPLLPSGGWPWGSWAWYPAQIPVLLLVFCVAALRHPRPALWGMYGLMLPVLWLW